MGMSVHQIQWRWICSVRQRQQDLTAVGAEKPIRRDGNLAFEQAALLSISRIEHTTPLADPVRNDGYQLVENTSDAGRVSQ